MGKLCEHCAIILSLQFEPEAWSQDFTLRSIGDYAPLAHFRTVKELIESAEKCRLCEFIQASWSLPALHKRGVSCNFIGGDIIIPWHAFADSFKVTITTCHVGTDVSKRPIWDCKELTKEYRIKTIKSWYTECSSQHAGCKPSTHGYPRRLIQIGPGNYDLRLVDTLLQPCGNIEYATLSYFWGTSPTSLPQTLQDAIDIIWGLELRYIWIDSLCIVQDDLQDWQREAASMKDVYAGSSITISASDAQDSTQGCFVDNDLDLWDGRTICFYQLGARLPNKKEFSIRLHQGDIRRRTKFSNLSTRGWKMQEQLLSRRVVHCMQPEIHWSCHCSYRTESQVTFEGDRFKSFSWGFMPQATSKEEMQKLWFEWMTDYSSRKLTVTRDRLGALAGMVQYFGNKVGFTHLLGCWYETLVDELLWIRRDDVVHPSMALSQVPFWSWLTRVGQIDFRFWSRSMGTYPCIVRDHIKIVEAGITWAGEPMVSDILSSIMVVEGLVREMRLRLDPRTKNFNPHFMNIDDEKPDFSETPIPWLCTGRFDLEDEREDDVFTCLLARSVSPEARFSTTEGTAYRRVGLAMIRGNKSEFTSAETKTIRLL
ncbi:het protein [Fusarium langsethiae]|uniref:Het protein n=1 Tax=Fusarium langsethiae TaxID=179993 RepID=A0A0M9ERM0_FUSLA|nr:het protein [Fusarium langsethiae]